MLKIHLLVEPAPKLVLAKVMDSRLDAGGKPSTWFPPGRLVEHISKTKRKYFNVYFNDEQNFQKQIPQFNHGYINSHVISKFSEISYKTTEFKNLP